MKLLLTGAGGYTGRGVAEALRAEGHHVRGLDIRGAEGVDEAVTGDLTDLDVCRAALQGMEAAVLCHMAPNPDGYKTPPTAIDVNVKGTANLYHAMAEAGIGRAVLISTMGVLLDKEGATAAPGRGPYGLGQGLYRMTKVMQEVIAACCYEEHGISTGVLRPSGIVYDGDLTNKYGRKIKYYTPLLTDPRDIGRAAAKCLALADLGLEAFDLAQEDGPLDLAPARERLGWRPAHRFEALDWDPKVHPGRPSRLKKG